MGKYWGSYWHIYPGSVVFLSVIGVACAIYLILRRNKAGEWATASACGAALLLQAVSMYKGTRVLVDGFESMAVSGSGGISSVAAALVESRIPVLIGAALGSAILTTTLASFYAGRVREVVSEERTGVAGPLVGVWACIIISILLVLLDYRLPNFIMKGIMGNTGLSMGKLSQTIAGGIVVLSTLSIIAIVIGILLLLFPVIRRLSTPAPARRALTVSGALFILLLTTDFAVILYQTVSLSRTVITGTFQGTAKQESALQSGAASLPDSPEPDDLIQPILSGDRKTVLALIERGVDVNGHSAFMGGTPLIFAVQKGRDEIVVDLLRAEAEVNLADERGMTPLMQAVLTDQLSVLPLFIKAGADVNLKDGNGATALMHAVSMGRIEAVNTLLEHQADPNAVDRYGISVLQIAQTSGNTDIVEALRKAGARD